MSDESINIESNENYVLENKKIFGYSLLYKDGFLYFNDDSYYKKFENFFSLDPYSGKHTAKAFMFRSIMEYAYSNKIECDSKNLRLYNYLDLSLKKNIIPRRFQYEALEAWKKVGKGVVSLPTGAGKTIFAIMAINQAKRPTLVVVPTLDLISQWVEKLSYYFEMDIGIIGGGYHRLEDITVTTYDSASLYASYLGARFGMIVYDECHHLPSERNMLSAQYSIAPYRLGLSATVERVDGKESIIYDLVGDLVYEAKINEIKEVLSNYKVVSVYLPLSDSDKKEYDEARSKYLSFIKRYGTFNDPMGWSRFIIQASQSLEGKEALKGYLTQKRIAQNNEEKLNFLWKILNFHCKDQIIIFTNDNDIAYEIGRRFILPVITHLSSKKERAEFLESFREKKISVLVSSKVLNEGVDVPSANVGVVVSGSGAVREHVQRLGRILRAAPGKKVAILYELISKDTSEYNVNQRRRDHYAYKGSN